MVYDGAWRPPIEFLVAATARHTGIRDYIAGEKVLQGFLAAYLSLADCFVFHSEKELNGGYAHICLEPHLASYPDMRHGYVVELKYLKQNERSEGRVDATASRAVEQLRQYLADPELARQFPTVRFTGLALVFRASELVRSEAVSVYASWNDYLGVANELKQALTTYTESDGRGRTAIDQGEAVALMQEKHEICCALFHGFDWGEWVDGTPAERLALLPAAQEHILAQEDGKDRYVKAVRELSQAFALAVPRDEALAIHHDVAFFQAVQAALSKRTVGDAKADEELDHAVRQIIDGAVAPEGVTDIFAVAGLRKPDISILSDEFLAEVRGMEHRNVAVELLRKLLNSEITTRHARERGSGPLLRRASRKGVGALPEPCCRGRAGD